MKVSITTHSATLVITLTHICFSIAHQIRNRSTKTFQALKSLNAQRRWCLTGTPVQNRIEDLFSLTEFLQIYPVDTYSNARKYIIGPLGEKDEQALTNLRLLMTSIALRRVDVACKVRNRSERVEMAMLSHTEREKYDSILTQARTTLASSGKKTAAHVLMSSILRLRQICSHGILSLDSNLSMTIPPTKRILNCQQCGDPLSLPTESRGDGVDLENRSGNSFCYDCALSQSNDLQDTVSQSLSFNQSGASTDVLTDEIAMDIDVDSANVYEDALTTASRGNSSKLEKVLSNLIQLQDQSKNSQSPIKR